VPRSRRASEPERELSPLAMYRAVRLEFTPEVTPLEVYGAALMQDYSGWWVYVLVDPRDGRAFYAGQSEHLYRRLDDHRLRFGERFSWQHIWLVKVANEAEADLIELVMIHFYQPECNDKGRRADLEAKVHRWGRGTKEFDNTVRARTVGNGPAPKRTGRGIT
jgi:hypothetical protein